MSSIIGLDSWLTRPSPEPQYPSCECCGVHNGETEWCEMCNREVCEDCGCTTHGLWLCVECRCENDDLLEDTPDAPVLD